MPGRRDDGRAVLLGPGWRGWRGTWRGASVLVGGPHGWSHRRRGRQLARFPGLASALAALWSARDVRDQRPWAVGWLSYEALAVLAGDLPCRGPEPDLATGCLLLEPCVDRTPPPVPVSAPAVTSRLATSLDDGRYRAAVAAILAGIAAGDLYQVNLTRRFRLEPWSGDAAALLAAVGQPPPDYLARVTAAGVDLVCGSMELLLRRRGERLETAPIKGTRPRGATEAEDRRLASELEADAKERAELAMVVDLERNDLGQVARPGSVAVPDPGTVHSWATVHHRVARVTATVDRATPWWRILAAVAPGGSVTGCPKRAAMALAADLETTPRGPYTGALGVIAGDGDLELALPIRTAWARQGRLEIGAGCGIVWGSDPVREEAESRLKVAHWLRLAEEDG